MSDAQQIANVLYSALGIIALWYLGICWRGYRTAKMREDIFSLRSELFEYGATGAISFDSQPYRQLRSLLNSMIRFAHEISFVRLSVTIVWEKIHPLMPGIPNFMDYLRADELSPEVFDKLAAIHRKLIRITALQILTTSVMASPMLAVYCIYKVVRFGLPRRAIMMAAERRQELLDKRINYHLQLIEQQAIETRKLKVEEQRCLTVA